MGRWSHWNRREFLTRALGAAGSYHRYKEDVELLQQMNLKSYRFSISWPRIQADGTGKPNPKGLDYYKRLTDDLLKAKIRRLCTLYHWDLPQKLEDAGGWPNRDLAGRFTDYAEIVAPTGFYELLMRISREYKGTAMEITENGCSYLDGPDEHGRVADDRRIQFLRGHLDELGRAMLYSCYVRAYHHWSLLDNFEWAEGFTQRFGLVYVDFRTRKRTIKDSGKWYAKLADTYHLQ